MRARSHLGPATPPSDPMLPTILFPGTQASDHHIRLRVARPVVVEFGRGAADSAGLCRVPMQRAQTYHADGVGSSSQFVAWNSLATHVTLVAAADHDRLSLLRPIGRPSTRESPARLPRARAGIFLDWAAGAFDTDHDHSGSPWTLTRYTIRACLRHSHRAHLELEAGRRRNRSWPIPPAPYQACATVAASAGRRTGC